MGAAHHDLSPSLPLLDIKLPVTVIAVQPKLGHPHRQQTLVVQIKGLLSCTSVRPARVCSTPDIAQCGRSRKDSRRLIPGAKITS